MANTVSFDAKTISRVLAQLDKLTRDVEAIKTRVFQQEPPYGSDAWWEWSHKKGLEDVKKGDYYELENKKDIDEFFNNINDENYIYSKFHHKSNKASK